MPTAYVLFYRKFYIPQVTLSNKMCKHKTKKRLYVRDQSSKVSQWKSTDLFLCDWCGKILKNKMDEVFDEKQKYNQ